MNRPFRAATRISRWLAVAVLLPIASFSGSYGFVHGEVLDFTIKAKPEGSGETLSMTYRERLWVPGLPAQ